MSLTKDDLLAIKKMFDDSFDERVPKIIDERVPKIIDERVPKIIDEKVPGMIEAKVQPMLDKLERRLTAKIDNLTLSVGQFSLETTERINALDKKLSDKIDDLGDKLEETAEMADTNRVEIAKIKRNTGMT